MDVLFKAILSLETLDECYDFFEDLCTMKELADMVQRVEAAKMLLSGNTYEQIVKMSRSAQRPSAGLIVVSNMEAAVTRKF